MDAAELRAATLHAVVTGSDASAVRAAVARSGAGAGQGEPDAAQAEKIEKLYKMMKAVTTMKLSKNDKDPAQVADGLYLGSIGCALNRVGLQALGVTHVLCVAGGIQPAYEEAFKYLTINVLDSPGADLTSHFPRMFAFIEEALQARAQNGGVGGVLVHCFAGKSRSTTTLCSYLMATRGMRMAEALELCKSKRPKVQPNAGFVAQMLRFERLGGVWSAEHGVRYTREAAHGGDEEFLRRNSGASA